MITNKRILAALFFIWSVVIYNSACWANPPGSLATFRLRETLRIGNVSEARPDDILIQPRHVLSDRTGRIWIADLAILAVKVFDQKGNHILTISRKGGGPGEFQDITTMTINLQGELVVVDYINARFTIFSPEGRFIATHRLPMNAVQWPRRIYCTPDSGYILLAKLESGESLFHYFTKDFRYVRSFGTLPIIYQHNAHLEKQFAVTDPGEFMVDSKGILYYAAGLFDGRIYVYEIKNEIQKTIFRSKNRMSQPYEYEFKTEFQPGPPPPQYQITMAGPDGMYYLRRNFISGGINVLDDGTVAHLVVSLKGKNHEIGVELFFPNGSVEYKRLAGSELPAYQWKASFGKWYLIDRREIPQVVEFILERVK